VCNYTKNGAVIIERKNMPQNQTFKVLRSKYFGARPELAANNLTKEQAEKLVSERQDSADGYAYQIERDN